MRHRRFFLHAIAVIAIVASVGTSVAQAQPTAPHHGPPRGGLSVLSLVLNPTVHSALGLSPDQETAWAALQSGEQALHTQMMSSEATLRTTVATEMAKPTPDLAAIDNAVAAQRASAASAMNALRAQALALYGTFSTGQQAVVIQAAQARYQGLQAHRPRGG